MGVVEVESSASGRPGVVDKGLKKDHLIAVGSYGERPLRALVVGSTPPRLMHVTHVPVLVVREPGP